MIRRILRLRVVARATRMAYVSDAVGVTVGIRPTVGSFSHDDEFLARLGLDLILEIDEDGTATAR